MEKRYFPIGSYVYCLKCDINLYELTSPIQSDDLLMVASRLKPIEPQPMPKPNDPLICSHCGNWVKFKLRRQPVGV